MQTKEHERDEVPWRDVNNCTRTFSENQVELLCEVTEHHRFMYAMRVVKRSKVGAMIEEVVVKEEGNYQSGLLCYSDHDVVDLRCSSVTEDTANVTWKLYKWDANEFLVDMFDVIVFDDRGLPYSHSVGHVVNRTQQHYYKTITGLKHCTNYNVSVRLHYFSRFNEVKRHRWITIRTKCSGDDGMNRKIAMIVSFLMMGVVVVCLLVLLCIVHFRRSLIRRSQHRTPSYDIVDDNFLGAFCKIRRASCFEFDRYSVQNACIRKEIVRGNGSVETFVL